MARRPNRPDRSELRREWWHIWEGARGWSRVPGTYARRQHALFLRRLGELRREMAAA